MMTSPITFNSFIKFEEYIYFFAQRFNSLYRMNCKTEVIEHLGFVCDKSIWCKNLYCKMIVWEKCIVIFPQTASNIIIYNTITKMLDKIELKSIESFPEKYRFHSGGFFNTIAIYGDRIIASGRFYPAIVHVNIRSREVYYNEKIIDELSIEKFSPSLPFFGEGFVHDNKMYIPCLSKGTIIEYNIKDASYIFHNVSNRGIWTIVYHQGHCFGEYVGDGTFQYDLVNEDIGEEFLFDFPFNQYISFNGKLLALCDKERAIYEIKEKSIVGIISIPYEEQQMDGAGRVGNRRITGIGVLDDRIILSDQECDTIRCFDGFDWKMIKKEQKNLGIHQIIRLGNDNKFDTSKIFCEEESGDLDIFVKAI